MSEAVAAELVAGHEGCERGDEGVDRRLDESEGMFVGGDDELLGDLQERSKEANVYKVKGCPRNVFEGLKDRREEVLVGDCADFFSGSCAAADEANQRLQEEEL
eukprot:CAMPEP_0182504970 /NCGR_PEP_ID=MMETSP1321-20130603/18195_1 /TAXON_ID=91990 /ORGANISM="Bolidomonas sp., Strain RCC1657" /LENGTH=103 /DNA_ID=CAMNT_0024710423 /DNA_START=1586 /DNA_END=1897 /DNA_ORIENTATION=-